MAGMKGYTNRVALVTGASSGVGLEMAQQLAARGMAVALVARRADRLRVLADKIEGAGGMASVHACDVSDRSAVASCARDIQSLHGRFDLLMNAAGYVRHVLFKDHALDDIEKMMMTNYMGTVYWIKEAVPLMRARGEGWIVNFSSFAGLVPQPDEAAYSATKCAITGLSEALASEFAPLGIHVMCVCPVLVETEMFSPEVMARLPKEAEKRFMPPERFVRGVLQALERGTRQVVLPKRYWGIVLLRTLFPSLISRKIGSVRLGVLDDVCQ